MRKLLAVLIILAVAGCASLTASKTVTVYTKSGDKNASQNGANVGLSSGRKTSPSGSSAAVSSYLPTMGFTIQAGAFSNPDNAAALTAKLDNMALDPYYFKYKDGLYKVRFGNFKTREEAKKTAEKFKKQGVITEYYIVSPDEYTTAKSAPKGSTKSNYVRHELVKTAHSYLGVPYQWGGNNKAGIDCSGLTQAVYNLNGLSIPRNSRAQYEKGKSISKKDLKEGDLVFFATSGGKTISHVGIYIGKNQFIHAPSRGKKVSIAKLNDAYWSKVYVGGRTYL